jgi:hypothetical protein
MKPGTIVRFAPDVVKRLEGVRKPARGIVLSVTGRVARVDFRGTWIPHEDGGTVRSVPLQNLVKA